MSTATGKVVVNRAMSLDGFIAGPGDEMGWIRDLAPQGPIDDYFRRLLTEDAGHSSALVAAWSRQLATGRVEDKVYAEAHEAAPDSLASSDCSSGRAARAALVPAGGLSIPRQLEGEAAFEPGLLGVGLAVGFVLGCGWRGALASPSVRG